MKVLKILAALNFIVFLTVLRSGKAMAFDTTFVDCVTSQTFNKGEWSVGVRLGGGGILGGYTRICPTSYIEALGLIQGFSMYYGLRIKCLENDNPFPSITLGVINGGGKEWYWEGDEYKIDSLYLTFFKDGVKNFNIYGGIGKGSTPPVGGGNDAYYHYNVSDYYLYGGIEKVVGKFKMSLGASRIKDGYKEFDKSSIYTIGCSYDGNKVGGFSLRLTGGFWSEKIFELPKNMENYLIPLLTIEYNRRIK